MSGTVGYLLYERIEGSAAEYDFMLPLCVAHATAIHKLGVPYEEGGAYQLEAIDASHPAHGLDACDWFNAQGWHTDNVECKQIV